MQRIKLDTVFLLAGLVSRGIEKIAQRVGYVPNVALVVGCLCSLGYVPRAQQSNVPRTAVYVSLQPTAAMEDVWRDVTAENEEWKRESAKKFRYINPSDFQPIPIPNSSTRSAQLDSTKKTSTDLYIGVIETVPVATTVKKQPAPKVRKAVLTKEATGTVNGFLAPKSNAQSKPGRKRHTRFSVAQRIRAENPSLR